MKWDLKLEQKMHVYVYNGIKFFNEILNEIKNSISLNIFKKKLAMHIKQEQTNL